MHIFQSECQTKVDLVVKAATNVEIVVAYITRISLVECIRVSQITIKLTCSVGIWQQCIEVQIVQLIPRPRHIATSWVGKTYISIILLTYIEASIAFRTKHVFQVRLVVLRTITQLPTCIQQEIEILALAIIKSEVYV